MFGCLAEQGMFDVLSFVSWITGKGADQTFQKICSMVIGLMNKLQDIGKIYRKTLAISAPSMEEYGTKLAPCSISCATKNVNLLPDPVMLCSHIICFYKDS